MVQALEEIRRSFGFNHVFNKIKVWRKCSKRRMFCKRSGCSAKINEQFLSILNSRAYRLYSYGAVTYMTRKTAFTMPRIAQHAMNNYFNAELAYNVISRD
jgi:hypothetical protein